MNIFIDTHFNYPEKFINKIIGLNKCSTQVNVLQLTTSDNKNVMKFIVNNINNDNSILIDKIEKMMNNTKLNDIFNKLCLLYLNGGILIKDSIMVNNIEKLIEIYNKYDICSIESCVNGNIFTGILSCKKGEEKILNIITRYLLDFEKTDINKLLMILLSENENKQYMLLNEKIVLDKSNIYFEEEIIAEHYFKTNNILEKYFFKNEIPNDLSKIKIGITLNMPSEIKDFYTNGIKQNCLYLYELLKNMNYDVKLILDNEKNVKVLDEIDFYKFEYVTYKNIFLSDFNLIFQLGFSFPRNDFNTLKNMGVKIVYYMCGNNYLIDTERVLYNQHKGRNINYNNTEKFDEIWIIPQMYNQNKYYCETLYRTKSIQIPFIWSPMSIKFVQKILRLDETSLMYKKKESKIGIFEPNISVMKWCLPSVLIAENTYRTYKNVKHVYITNLNRGEPEKSDINQFVTPEFNNMVRGLDLFKDGKLSSEDRHITLAFLKQHCDIVISHQWENPLNYLYLEVAWLGWPILHNAHLCKDVGYYYDGFNYLEGSEKLNHILINHEANAKEYLKKNREIISVFIPENKLLQDRYKQLINNLFI